MSNIIDKNTIIETAYSKIKDSIEWADSLEGNEYSFYIEGIVVMTDGLLDVLKEEPIAEDYGR